MTTTRLTTPRLTVAGLSGDSGKTLVSLGLVRLLCRRGLAVAPFKKGPDYIDAGWLGFAAGRAGRNLDTFLMETAGIGTAVNSAAGADVMLIEGNRGLFDGMDAEGSHSTAVLAKLIGSPVVLVVDATKMTRTAAALVLGCRAMDPELDLAGVVLNRVATARHERVAREAVEKVAGVPVLGAVPRLPGDTVLPGRHLGLVTAVEHPDREAAICRAAEELAVRIDVDAVVEAARRAPAVELPALAPADPAEPVTVAVVRDEAFSFHYPDNLDALRNAGAALVEVSPLADTPLPCADAVVIGGGFPEVHATRLASSTRFLESLRAAADAGIPVYAECGGLMLLARELVVGGDVVPMAGVLDLVVEQTPRPQGHGYVAGTVTEANPFFPVGTVLRGHEFHYSRVVDGSDRTGCAMRVDRGTGLGAGGDAVVRGSVWAAYTHLHALGTPEWARGIVAAAREQARRRSGGCACAAG